MSETDQYSEDDPPSAAKSFPLPLIIGASIVALSSAGALWALWAGDPGDKTLEYEAAKTLMQVLGIVLLGGIFSYAVASLQVRHQTYEKAMDRKQTDDERRDTDAQDERRRLDELRRELLGLTITTYNSVKKSRRRLRAAGYGGESPPSDKEAHEAFRRELENINDASLEFERLQKLCPLAGVDDTKARQGDDLETLYSRSSSYLKRIYGEYERPAQDPEPGKAAAGPLSEFLAKRDVGQFDQFAKDARLAVEKLHKSLLEGIHLAEASSKNSDARPNRTTNAGDPRGADRRPNTSPLAR